MSIFLVLFFFTSCEPERALVGNWIEVNYEVETLTFHNNGELEIKQVGIENKTPVNFKYEIMETQKNYILFNISVFSDTTFRKKIKNKAIFKDENTITVENLDFPETTSNTYKRKK